MTEAKDDGDDDDEEMDGENSSLAALDVKIGGWSSAAGSPGLLVRK